MALLEIKNISKSFQNNQALQNVSLTILPNKIYGLLGPNGAGKTTLIRNITQIFYPDSGEILFNGENLQPKHSNQIGYMPEERGMYKKMKVGEQLIYFAKLRDFNTKQAEEKIDYWLQKLDIESWRNKNIEDLSKGMQQKVQFVATILHEPKLLILDEPFSGLDPIAAELIKNEIIELNQKGTTIIFSTHRMENIEEMCEDIFLINKGKIILDGNVQQIKQDFKQHLYKISLAENVQLNEKIQQSISIQKHENNELIIQLNQNQKPNDVLRILLDNNIELNSITEILPTVGEIFIQKVKQIL
ncbi:MAG: ATP-binding cassette domain-containing protein [Saprospirales bacterium]|jgi:ABC-2 type transport system ATP-binding protein|nr:ATP-binding cassette domain-containing protein [Saprospirales bacterium]